MYSIRELSELTGVSVRTIQYYVQRGVLSPPLPKAGRVGLMKHRLYTHIHLKELRKTQEILDRNMTLEDIRDHLHPVEDDDE